MQEGGMNLSLNDADIRKRYSIKECKIVLHQVVDSENDIMWNSEINDVSALDDPSINKVIRKKKRMTSRINRFGRNRLRLGRRRQRKVTQLIQDSLNDENTTNSENSENNTLYNEIDWEENLECDTPLVDEFAPRVASPINEIPLTSTANIPPEIITKQDPSPLQLLDKTEYVFDPAKEKEFQPGREIYVQMFETSKWYATTIVEVDWEDSEVLVHYREGDPPPSDEWVRMNSQRLSKVKPHSLEKPIENKQKEPSEESIKVKEEPIDSFETNITDSFKSIDIKEEPKDSQIDGDSRLENQVISYFKPTMARGRKTLKKNKSSLPQKSSLSGNNKFVIGEDVLAKWSDHRMQKFPAKIKSISGGGMYSVLFYDGYEKTLSEDQLFKTTPEEVAKYKQANPSEADSFVDMDADSKEARRQRKKKTFDDYVFAKDYRMTKRRVLKSAEHFGISKKMSFYPKTSDSKDLSDVETTKPLSRKKMRRRRRALFGPKRDNPKMKLHMLDMARETLSSQSPNEHQDNENFYGFDTAQADDSSADRPESFETDLHKNEDLRPEIPLDIRPENPIDIKPISIAGTDGVHRKSVVVPDKKLPEGWSKHAVLLPGDKWEVLLLSPDGFQIANEEELKRYYGTLPDGGEPPSSLDFIANFDILPNLCSQQKELPVVGTPKIWLRRKPGPGRGRRGGRSHIGAPAPSLGRVRTLLPKQRLSVPSPVPSTPLPSHTSLQHLPASVPPAPESDIWRCPKEACDKKFRKESLLQMHIKHYHSELSSLVRSVPNMVDLACARSESNNCDWTPNNDALKVPQTTVKRILPRPFPTSPNNSDNTEIGLPDTPLPSIQGPSRSIERSLAESTPLKRQSTIDERRTTIKTMLPIRQSSDISSKSNMDSDDADSEDDYIEQKKNGSRIFKPGKFRRGGKTPSGSRGDENIGEFNVSQMPTFKFTKRRKLSEKLLTSTSENYDSFPEEEKPLLDTTDDGVVIERLKSEEVINCICGFREEDGLMIQCDICMCWQHGLCSNIENESDVPDRYVCTICREPFRVRSSRKYSYAQQYLTQGKLPTFNFRSRNDDAITHREMILKRSFELSSSLYEIKDVGRSLAAKINIAEKSDHPKLYMWAKNWDEAESKTSIKLLKDTNDVNSDNSSPDIVKNRTGPEPEAPIDLEECRIRLLDHVEHYYSQIEDRLTSLQTQIAALESLDPDLSSIPGSDKTTKQTIQMLLRDLTTINKLAAIS